MADRELIHTGIVEHRHGTNVYVSRTEAGLLAQVAEYCREWWHELPETDDEDLETTPPDDDAACVEKYFSRYDGGFHETESFIQAMAFLEPAEVTRA